MKKLSSVDQSYKTGHLSVFPKAKDSKLTLHEAKNNAEDFLQQTLAINSKYIILSDASKFPNSGIIKITSKNAKGLLENFEVIFYARKIGNQLHLLHRGYGGSPINSWTAGSKVSCPLMAEHHNALKDAIINIQQKIGLQEKPSSDSINGILTYMENKWLSPKPTFRAYPKSGSAPLAVTFHNFSTSHEGKFLWDFGDGSTSTETHPIHIYNKEGKYSIRLTMILAGGPQGLSEKSQYIEVGGNNQSLTMFHVTPMQGNIDSEFKFTDQSDGDIIERHWFFGDGTEQTISNKSLHSISHKYKKSGKYVPILVVRMSDNSTKRMFLQEGINVSNSV